MYILLWKVHKLWHVRIRANGSQTFPTKKSVEQEMAYLSKSKKVKYEFNVVKVKENDACDP